MNDKSPTIQPGKEWPLSMDFDLLRKEAIAFNQQASGDRWTDYNFHDPGVTILEQFCYALTDIAYRTNLDVETILFHGGDVARIRESHALHGPSEILTPGPITEEDYRVLVLDGFPNTISNCWIDRIGDHGEGVRGLYDVTLLLHGHVSSDEHAGIRDEVRRFLTRYRNLAEDFERITILEPLPISVSADIDLFQDTPGEEILAEILFQIEQYFNPMVRFRSLDEMERMGLTTAEIFDTPSHVHGFILRRELEARQQQYYVSRIGDCISAVRGVKMVRNLRVMAGGVLVYGDLLDVPMRNFLTLGFTGAHAAGTFFEDSRLNIFKGGTLSSFSAQTVVNLLEIRLARTHRNYPIRTDLRPVEVPQIRTEELMSYESVQKTFPSVYGIGDFTPAHEEGHLRTAQSAQLKAYLLLFDQVMVSHLAQLAGISELFSVYDADPDDIRTYFSRRIADEGTGADELLHHTIGPASVIQARIKELESSDDKDRIDVRFELAACRTDLAEKAGRVDERINMFLKELPDMTLTGLKRSEFKGHADIVRLAAELIGSLVPGTKTRFTGRGSRNLSETQQQAVIQLSEALREHLMEQPLDCAFRQHHLDRLMRGFDQAVERKNRILSHYLARFGQRFSSDFHQRFTTLLEDEDPEKLGRKIIGLKSTFLQEIRVLGRYRAQGLDYLSKEKSPDISFRRRVALQLNIEHEHLQRLTAQTRKSVLKARSVTRRDIVREDLPDGRAFIRPAEDSERVRFLINGSDYHGYLFRYAVKRRNYQLVPEAGRVAVYFSPSDKETPTRIMWGENRKDAERKIRSVIRSLKELNARQEGFHVVDHILLRPMDMHLCRFLIRGAEKDLLLVSKQARTREAQQRDAFDTVLLACYPINYKVLRNTKKEFVVMVKNPIGKEMAEAVKTFMTELKAQEFIDACVTYFNGHREADTLHTLYELDDETKFYFCVTDHNQQVLLQAIEPSDLGGQEEAARSVMDQGLYPDRYRLQANLENSYGVLLTDAEDRPIARSRQHFATEELAREFIRQVVRCLDDAKDPKSLVQYRRVNGRNSDDFNARLSVLYPKWTSRFGNEDFLQMFIRVLHESAPAHLALSVIGLDYAEMNAFEDLYFSYLKELSMLSLENRHTVSKLSGELLDFIATKK